jgi:DNA alkylation repair enzyme alkD family protein
MVNAPTRLYIEEYGIEYPHESLDAIEEIAKRHTGEAVSTAALWLVSSDNSPRTRWIVTKGLRTLIKKGDPAALKVVEAEPDPYVSVQEVDMEPSRLTIGERAEICVVVANKSTTARDVVVDYQIHFRRSDGTLRPTTFKLGRVTVRLRASLRAPS